MPHEIGFQQHYIVFEKALFALNQTDDADLKKQYVAIPAENIKMGIFVPHSHPELGREPVGEIDATNDRQAVDLFREKIGNLML
jgi:hypothetical protein